MRTSTRETVHPLDVAVQRWVDRNLVLLGIGELDGDGVRMVAVTRRGYLVRYWTRVRPSMESIETVLYRLDRALYEVDAREETVRKLESLHRRRRRPWRCWLGRHRWVLEHRKFPAGVGTVRRCPECGEVQLVAHPGRCDQRQANRLLTYQSLTCSLRNR